MIFDHSHSYVQPDDAGAPAEWRSNVDFAPIIAEVPTLRAYYLKPSPTAAESVEAIKSIIRVLRALLRDT